MKMKDKTMVLMKEKDMVIPFLLFKNHSSLKISPEELIVIIYFINNGLEFDVVKIADYFNKKPTEIMKIIESLSDKSLIKIETKKQNGNMIEIINLDNLYQKLLFEFMNVVEPEIKTDIYSVFEREFARTLSPIEYELINGWLEKNFLEETIILALKEAVYNGVSNLKYIDKILYEWNKKGIRTEADVQKAKSKFQSRKHEKSDLFDYDWLNDEE
jgi:DNA replication protein